jgi:hypothetical protein
MMHTSWPRRRGEAGQALVEFALILPLLAFVILIAADGARMIHRHVAITNAAREGARVCALNRAWLAASPPTAGPVTHGYLEARVRSELGPPYSPVTPETPPLGVGWSSTPDIPDSFNYSAACPISGAGTPLVVRVDTTFTFLTPFLASMAMAGCEPAGTHPDPVMDKLQSCPPDSNTIPMSATAAMEIW